MERNQKSKEKGNGQGTLYKSSKTGLYVGQYVYNGKRHSIYQKKNEKIGDFKNRFNNTLSSINQGNYIEKSNDTFMQILKSYVEQKYNDGLVSDRTYFRDLSSIKQIEKTCSNFINKPIQKIKVEDIEEAKVEMRNYSNSTIDKLWCFINKTFRIAVSRRKIQYNIMDDESVAKPISKLKDKSIEALTIKEEKKLIDVLNNEERYHKYRNVILLQLFTGMRIGEVLALSTDCINLKNSTITVYRTLTTDKSGNVVLGSHTKTYSISSNRDKGKRTFPMSSNVKKIINEILQEKVTNINKLLFYDYVNNCCIKRTEINSYLKRISEKYNITTSSLHSHRLRHTYITRCVENGMNLQVIQQIVGHIKGSSITSDVYTSISNEFMTKELKKINY